MLFSDDEWAEVCPMLPTYEMSPKGGRPRLNKRKVIEGIYYLLDNKLPWNAAPPVYGSGTALNDYFREWAKKGAFQALKKKLPPTHPLVLTLDWEKIESLQSQSAK